jgi:hypothetical protein
LLGARGEGAWEGQAINQHLPDFCQRPVPRFSLAPPVEFLL